MWSKFVRVGGGVIELWLRVKLVSSFVDLHEVAPSGGDRVVPSFVDLNEVAPSGE